MLKYREIVGDLPSEWAKYNITKDGKITALIEQKEQEIFRIKDTAGIKGEIVTNYPLDILIKSELKLYNKEPDWKLTYENAPFLYLDLKIIYYILLIERYLRGSNSCSKIMHKLMLKNIANQYKILPEIYISTWLNSIKRLL